MTTTTTDEFKNIDLSPSAIKKFSEPKETWFIKRGDGMIFACEETEAWKTLTNRSGWNRTDFKIIGVSDGKTYVKVVRESKINSVKVLAEIKELEVECDKYRKTEENFIFKELLKTNDPKVKRVKKIISDLDKKLEKKNNEYKMMTQNVAKLAFDAELAVAIKGGVRKFPSNQDIFTPGATPNRRRKILNKMMTDDDE